MRESRDISFDYLRATLTLMVVAHHSMLAYAGFARHVPGSAPVVDETYWLFFDYAENFDDVFFMSLMFFVSGLFVPGSLRRAGAAAFLKQRALRLGAPFAVGVLVLMPLAYYGAWRAAGHTDDALTYWRLNITAQGWPVGPLWFVWVLLLFDVLAAALYAAGAGGRTPKAPDIPWLAFAAMFVVCAFAYLPMLSLFGFSLWAPLVTKPFYFQVSRIFLYRTWFAAGAWIGAGDRDTGLLARDGRLARGWRLWAPLAFVDYNLLVFVPRLPPLRAALSTQSLGAVEANLWVLSCVASGFAFLALFRSVVRRRRGWMDSLTRCAYAIYLVHYVFVLWAQYALKGWPLPAGVKFLAVFISATGLSWLSAQALLRLPGARRVL